MRNGKAAGGRITAAITIIAGVAWPACGKPQIIVPAPSEDRISRDIAFADLNLTVPADQERLARRVGLAVGSLCDEAIGGPDQVRLFYMQRGSCIRAAWDQARPQMALAMQRAREIASTGRSSILAAALTIAVRPQ